MEVINNNKSKAYFTSMNLMVYYIRVNNFFVFSFLINLAQKCPGTAKQ